MEIFQQNEWHGMARYGKQKKDPLSSSLEINTRPGTNQLSRVSSREPYLGGVQDHVVLGAPAIQFRQLGSHLKFDDVSGAVGLNASGGMVANVCFKWDPRSDYPNGDRQFLMGWISGPDYDANADDGTAEDHSWCMWVEKTGDDWFIHTSDAHDATPDKTELVSDDALVAGSWYWARFHKVGGSGHSLYVFKDGSASYLDYQTTSRAYVANGITDGALYLGGNPWTLTDSLGYGAIAYASLTATAGTAWEPQVARATSGDLHFLPTDTRQGVFSGKFESSTNKESWTYFPMDTLYLNEETTTDGGDRPLKGKGVKSFPGMGYLLDMPQGSMFNTMTTFMFELDATEGEVTILQSADGMFQIDLVDTAATNRLLVRWMPYNFASADAYLTYSADLAQADDVAKGWFAVQVDPNTQGVVVTVSIFKYNVGTDVWDDISQVGAPSVGGTDGDGIYGPNTDKWFFNVAHTCISSILDFRVNTGNTSAGWKAANLDTEITGVLPKGTITWLNSIEDIGLSLEDNVRYLKHPEHPGDVDRVSYASDRVTGRYCLSSLPGRSNRWWTGCPYIENTFPLTAEDVYVDSSGELEVSTDACRVSYDGTTLSHSDQLSPMGHQRSQMAFVGADKYIVGPPPLQVLGPTAHPLNIYYQPVKLDPTFDGGNGSIANDVGTSEKICVTIYDPMTGNESNHIGPTTVSTNAVAADTCRIFLTVMFYYHPGLASKRIRVYRLSDSTGLYHLETEAPFDNQDEGGNVQVYWSYLTLTKADALLVLGESLEYDNNITSQALTTYIWNSRAWSVPVKHPSRIYYSKPYQFGSFPPGNVAWTDEGMSGNILGCLASPSGLLLIRERSIWIVPSAPEAFYAQPFVPDVGGVSGDCAVFAEGILWWAAAEGIHSYDGSRVINHSERLDGVDRKVWDHAPRKTRCWYDKENWRVVWACDGAGVSVDVRTGAVALLSEPAACYAFCSSSSYTGGIWGSDGMVWKESAGNKSLSLDTSQAQSSEAFSDVDSSPFVLLNWYGALDSDVGDAYPYTSSFTAQVGIGTVDAYTGDNEFFATDSPVGRCHAQWDLSALETWGKVVVAGEASGAYYLKTSQPLLDKTYLDRTPVYYESQYNYLGLQSDNKFISRVDFLCEDEYTSAEVIALVTTDTLEGTAIQVPSSATAYDFDAGEPHVQHIRTQGHRTKYSVQSHDGEDLPGIMEVRTHFRRRRPRGRP